MSAATVRDLAAWSKRTQTQVVFHALGGLSLQALNHDDHEALTLSDLERHIITALQKGDVAVDADAIDVDRIGDLAYGRLKAEAAKQDRNMRTTGVSSRLARSPADGYESLANVLDRAWHQATAGKGAERHAQGRAFEDQPMQDLCDLYGVGFALGQAGKKAQESQRLPRDRAVAELLGAIVYLAGAIVHMERSPAQTKEGQANG